MNLFGKQYSWMSVGIFAALILLVSYYIGTRTGKGKAGAADVEAMKKEISAGALTYEKTQYETFAQRLYMALYDLFSDEEEVLAVFTKMRTKSDVLQLITTFGKRGTWIQLGEKTLPEWLYFKNADVSKINEILQRNAIQFEF